ncbi:MAG: alpha/beta-type small acid-soluble spore protein [Clostridia bacterium]|nr:alpha/beta-type small acid-soluble spore protein [Clostridia bacterium]
MYNNSNKSNSSNREMKSRLGNFKNEVASSMNINLQNGYNGDIAARDAGRIGGQMVKRMIEYAENNMNGSMNSMNNSNSGSNNMMR